MNLSSSDVRLYSSRRTKQILTQAVAALAMLGAHNADAQTWEYLSYLSSGQASAPGYVTLEEKSGKPIFSMMAGNLAKCNRGDLDATVTRNDATTIITVVPPIRGCEEIQFVIKNDGTGGRREVKTGSDWSWDGLERGLTLKK